MQLRNFKLRKSGTVQANTFKFKPIYSMYRHTYNFIPYFIRTLNNAIPTIVMNIAKLYLTLQRPRASQEVEVDSNRTLQTPVTSPQFDHNYTFTPELFVSLVIVLR
jgi:hypothetical protein